MIKEQIKLKVKCRHLQKDLWLINPSLEIGYQWCNNCGALRKVKFRSSEDSYIPETHWKDPKHQGGSSRHVLVLLKK